MDFSHVNYFNSKGQMKIQEMAFVLVAILIFFGMVFLVFLTISIKDINYKVDSLKESESQQAVKRIASSPEFAFTVDNELYCDGCIDMNKVLVLKERGVYADLLDLDYIEIEVIYPQREGLCARSNFPECRTLVVLNETKGKEMGITKTAYVSLCRQEFHNGNYIRCDFGKIKASKGTLI